MAKADDDFHFECLQSIYSVAITILPFDKRNSTNRKSVSWILERMVLVRPARNMHRVMLSSFFWVVNNPDLSRVF